MPRAPKTELSHCSRVPHNKAWWQFEMCMADSVGSTAGKNFWWYRTGKKRTNIGCGKVVHQHLSGHVTGW